MRAIIKSLPFAGITVLAWGSYGPTIHAGEAGLGSSKWAAFLCVGLAYFIIAVIIPLVWLKSKGEGGHWTKDGFIWGLGAGTCGALGALGIITAISSGGSPSYVMPIVFGGAPVVNTLVSMWMGKLFGQATNGFYLGIILVGLGTVGVFYNRPEKVDSGVDKAAVAAKEAQTEEETNTTLADKAGALGMIIGGICLTVLCWGSYGSVLHKSQAKMAGSRLRPLLCVGLAYFLIAVLVPIFIINSSETVVEWTNAGVTWSIIAGSCGAVGALGIILSFTFGGRPSFVMPIVFGGAPIINTLIFVNTNNTEPVNTMFIVSLTVVILGAITTLVCAPKPGKPAQPPVDADPVTDEEASEVNESPKVAVQADADTSREDASTEDDSVSEDATAESNDDVDGGSEADESALNNEEADDIGGGEAAPSESSEDDTTENADEEGGVDSLSDSSDNDSNDDIEGEGLVADDSVDDGESEADIESTEDNTASEDD